MVTPFQPLEIFYLGLTQIVLFHNEIKIKSPKWFNLSNMSGYTLELFKLGPQKGNDTEIFNM